LRLVVLFPFFLRLLLSRVGIIEDAADAVAPQARKIIFRAAQRIKKVDRRCVRAKETFAARKDGSCRAPAAFVNHNVAIPFGSSNKAQALLFS